MIKLFGGTKRPNIETLKQNQDIHGLIEALNFQEDHNIRREAALALGQIGESSVVNPLINCLQDHKLVREVAARSLGEIGDSNAIDPLIQLLNDQDWEVRGSAAKALGKIGDEKAINPLINALHDAKPSERWFIAHALESITEMPLSLDPEEWKSRFDHKD